MRLPSKPLANLVLPSVRLPVIAARGNDLPGPIPDGSPGIDGGSRRARDARTPRWPWWVLGFVLGAIVYLCRPAAGLPGGGLLYRTFLAFVVVMIALLAVLVLLQWIRPRRGRVAFALKMARSGRVDWAIHDIQRQIDRRGPSAERTGALGDCYLLREEWRQAYIHYLEAERVDDRKGRFLAKQGFALWKLGRGAEAATLLERASAGEPLNPSHAWTSCLILADLGRYQEARDQLRKAELLLEKIVPLEGARRRALEDSIEVCRKRLAEVPEPPLDPG